PYYLVSPIIDISLITTPVYLSFWRYLNSDFPPYMDSTVEVFNGTAWVKIFSMAQGMGINDAEWVHESYDVTPYKHKLFQIRWGWEVHQLGVANVAGWNVDDVQLVPDATCF